MLAPDAAYVTVACVSGGRVGGVEGLALRRAAAFRNRFAPPMEYLIDSLMCPRGFWSPALNIDMHGTEFLDDIGASSRLTDRPVS